MELTEIFGLLYPFADAFIKNVINNIGLDIIKNKKEKEIIEREKNKTIEELHELIDANEDNWIIISGDFYNFIKYNAGDLISQLLETNSYTYSTKSKESEVKQLLELYDTNFCGVSSFEKSLGTDFIKRFFEVCFKFKKNLFIALIHGDTKHVLEYELNENMLLKINENIESVLECFQKVSDYIELKSTNIQEIKEISINADGRKSVEYFSELFENPLIFEEKEIAKRLKDVFVWPEYKSNLLKNKQDDLEQLIYEFLKGNLRIFLYNKGVPKLKIESNYNLSVIFGMAGMGKSSLLEKIAYDIIHNAILINENNIFFVKFSSMECKHKSLLENIASNLGVEKSILKNSTIILDAFDEFILKDVEKQKMLELFCQEIVFLNSKVIITSRENYIDTCSLQNTFAIKLLSFNVNKRKEWLNKYDKNLPAKVIEDICNYRDETDLEGEEFIGIPIITYMVASNCVRISDYSSKYEFYNALFGLNGIWYKRMYDVSHPILLTRHETMFNFILNVSEFMFKKNKMSIHREDINKIIEAKIPQEDVEYLQNWYGIITYFRKNKLREIEFAHKSIYEYYIAYRIYNQLVAVAQETQEETKCRMLQSVFNKNIVTKEMLYFLDGFVEMDFTKLQYGNLIDTVKLIINKDIFFKSYADFKDFEEVCNYFCNSFNCLNRVLSKKQDGNLINVLDKHNQEHFSFFLRNKAFEYLYMGGYDLSNKCLRELLFKNVDLSKSDMKNSDFSYCDFSNANLEACDLSNSNLFSVTFSDTNLCYADLRGANLNNSIIKKDKKYFFNTKINVYQLKYFWPDITMFYQYLKIYNNNVNLASRKEIEFEFDKIRGFHLDI